MYIYIYIYTCMYMIPLSSSRYLCSLYKMVTDSGSPQNEI